MIFKKNILALFAVMVLIPACFAHAAENKPAKKAKNKIEKKVKTDEQFSFRIFCANMMAAGVAGLAGATFRTLWWEIDRNNEYFWSKIFASIALLSSPHAFARKIGASESLADVALVSGAVFAH